LASASEASLDFQSTEIRQRKSRLPSQARQNWRLEVRAAPLLQDFCPDCIRYDIQSFYPASDQQTGRVGVTGRGKVEIEKGRESSQRKRENVYLQCVYSVCR